MKKLSHNLLIKIIFGFACFCLCGCFIFCLSGLKAHAGSTNPSGNEEQEETQNGGERSVSTNTTFNGTIPNNTTQTYYFVINSELLNYSNDVKLYSNQNFTYDKTNAANISLYFNGSAFMLARYGYSNDLNLTSGITLNQNDVIAVSIYRYNSSNTIITINFANFTDQWNTSEVFTQTYTNISYYNTYYINYGATLIKQGTGSFDAQNLIEISAPTPQNQLLPKNNDFNYIICKEFTDVWQKDTSGGDYGTKIISFETSNIIYHFWLFPSVEEMRLYTEANNTLTLVDTYAYNNDSYLCFIYDKVSGGNYLEFGICESRFNTDTNRIYYYKTGGDDDIVNNTEISQITFNESSAGIFQDDNNILPVEQIPPHIANYTNATIYTYGYNKGYADGLEGDNAFSPFWNILSGVFSVVGNVMAIELVPHVPLGVFFLIPFFFGALGFVFWIWKGRN